MRTETEPLVYESILERDGVRKSVAVKVLRFTIDKKLSPALGLSVAFNASDGD